MSSKDNEYLIVLQQAAAWYARLSDETVSEHDFNKWQRWLDTREEHRSAWNLVEQVGGKFAPFDNTAQREGAYKALQVNNSLRMSRRQALLAIGAATLAGSVGWTITGSGSTQDLLASVMADYSTRVGETREFTFDTGLRFWLNTASALDVKRSAAGQQLHLFSGEVLIEPSPSAVVTTRHGLMAASDARFSVQLMGEQTCVTAYAGTVSVRTSDDQCALAAGQQVTLTSTRISQPQPAAASSLAWIDGLLIAQDMPLGQFIEQLARYRPGHLSCSEGISNLRVVGSFSVTDTDRALAALAAALPVKVRRRWSWWVVVEAST